LIGLPAMTFLTPLRTALAAVALILPLLASAQEDAIRKNLVERKLGLGQIDEVSKTPMPGLYEVRVGTDLFYTDAEGTYLIQGELMDTRARKNLTEERTNKLSAIAFDDLPMKNAITVVSGNGKRQLAVFVDPNCGYCKRFERDVQSVKDVTMHLFLIPILGPDSVVKARNIWCAKDRAKAWNDWMLQGVTPETAQCNTDALNANLEFAQKHRVTGTPTLVFASGARVPGAIGAQQLEQMLER
jgi:thiol:disulfide interchange protein DsbC